MDKLLTVSQKKATKQPKNKKKPVKVVYITNPIKFETSASEFRSLVQELTGQDSDLPDCSKYPQAYGVGDDETTPEAVKVVLKDHHAPQLEVPPTLEELQYPLSYAGVSRRSSSDLGGFDAGLYTPQMVDNFDQELMPPSNLWHETSQLDVLKGLDAM